MAGYIGSKIAVTQVDGYNRTEADAEFVNDPNAVITVSGSKVGIGTTSPAQKLDVSGSIAVSDTTTSTKRLQLDSGANSHTINSANYGLDMMDLNIQAENLKFNTGLIGVAERMRIDSSGNVGINAADPDVNSTSAKLLHIAGTASNTGPAGLMMTGNASEFGKSFSSTEVFMVQVSSATEICRFTGTGANGYQAYIRIVVTGHTGTVGNGTLVKEYVWGGSTTSPTQISSTPNGNAPTISFDNTTANVCIIKLASSDGTNGFNGVMKVEWLNPLDFAGSTYTVS